MAARSKAMVYDRSLVQRSFTDCGASFRVCGLETSKMRRPWPALGHSATEKRSHSYGNMKYSLHVYRSINLYAGTYLGIFAPGPKKILRPPPLFVRIQLCVSKNNAKN